MATSNLIYDPNIIRTCNDLPPILTPDPYVQKLLNMNDDQRTLNSTQWEDMNLSSYAVYGGAFVLSVDSLMYPFEMIRTRMQADNITHNKSILSTLRRIIYHDGFLRLYRGITPTVLGTFPAQSSYYATYEYTHYKYDQVFKRHFRVQNLSTGQDFACHALAGLSAELISACFYLPADTISQRLQNQPKFNFHHMEFQYRGALDVLKSIYRHQGIRGFYCGLNPHLLAYAPSGAVYFGVYEYMKKRLTGYFGDSRHSLLINAVSASIAGGSAVCVSNPMDVLRTRVQTFNRSRTTKPIPSIWQQTYDLWRTEGLVGFTKGLRPRLMIAMPGSMIALSGYELIKGWAKGGEHDHY